MSSACRKAIRAALGRPVLNADSAMPSRIFPSSYWSPISLASRSADA